MILRKFHILRANDFFRSEFRIFERTSGYTAVKNAEFALNEFDLILARKKSNFRVPIVPFLESNYIF